jgi:hypothetical protein
VKITPAHDFNDYEVGKRHNLPLINIFDKNAAVLAKAQVFNIDGSVNSDIDGSLPAKPSPGWIVSRRASRSSPRLKPLACSKRSNRTR